MVPKYKKYYFHWLSPCCTWFSAGVYSSPGLLRLLSTVTIDLYVYEQVQRIANLKLETLSNDLVLDSSVQANKEVSSSGMQGPLSQKGHTRLNVTHIKLFGFWLLSFGSPERNEEVRNMLWSSHFQPALTWDQHKLLAYRRCLALQRLSAMPWVFGNLLP